jgi:hypothetical protein
MLFGLGMPCSDAFSTVKTSVSQILEVMYKETCSCHVRRGSKMVEWLLYREKDTRAHRLLTNHSLLLL